MNVPAVVPIPCSSSSPCSFVVRQSSSANVSLLCSPLHRSSSSSTGGCALLTSLSPSFFQLSYRRRKVSSSKKVLVVRARSSVEERDGDGSQLQGSLQKKREEPASKARVSWSSGNNARGSWAPQKHQDRASWSPEKQQVKDFWSSASHHARPVSSPSQYKDSFSQNNQQGAFPSSQTLQTNPNFSRKPPTSDIDPTAASRLQNRLPAFKQAAEPDAFGASFLSEDGASAFSSFNPSNVQKSQGSLNVISLEEGGPQNGSVFTSKLEEILNKFRTRESGFKQSSSRDDPYKERRRNGAATSVLQSDTNTAEGFQATRSKANRSQANDAWEPSRKDIQHPRNGAFVHETSVEDENYKEKVSFLTTSAEGRLMNPHGERRLAVGKGNAGGHHKTESASFNLSASSPPMRWEGRSPASKMQSPVKNGSSNLAGTRVKSGLSQSSIFVNNRKSPNLELQAGHKVDGRGKRTEPSSMNKQDQKFEAQNVVHEFDWTDSDTEENADTVLPITLDTGDDRATSSVSKEADQPTSGSSTGVKTGSPESINKDRIPGWHSHSIPSLPFEFQYSYSETPTAPVIRYREEPYSPFGPDTMGRPWTGGPPLKKSKKNQRVFDSFNPPPKGKKGIKFVQAPGPYPAGQGPKPARSREEILGEPLTGEEIVQLVDSCQNEKRLLNLGRDGLTHNMLDLVHSHWKRRRAIKIRCLGVPTVDMDNVCFHLEDKTGGKIIYRSGGIVYLFRGRNYNYKDRPVIPLMLWKPRPPVYPRLIKQAPVGLTKEEAYNLRQLGWKVEPLCTLGKNGVYLTLVKDVRDAFKVDELVRIDCRGLNPSDYKKIGAKLRDLVPCVLLSFDGEQIFMWKGRASVSADVDMSNRMEAAEGSDSEAARPSVFCAVGSENLGMVETQIKVLADIAMADGAGDKSCSAIEEVKQRSVVVDTIGDSMEEPERSISAYGAKGWSGKELPCYFEVFNDHTAAAPSWSATDEGKNLSSTNEGISNSCSSDERHASAMTGTTNQISSPELVKNDASLEESKERELAASSEVGSSLQTVLAVEDDMILDKSDLVAEYTITESENDRTTDFSSVQERDVNAASETQFLESRQSLESNLMNANDKEDEVMLPKAGMTLDRRPSTKLESRAGKEGRNDAHAVVRVDALWDHAIASGMAIQLDEVDTDSDLIIKKVSELAKTVPVEHEYTKKLLSKLRVRKENIPRPDDDLRIHFRNLQKLKNQKRISKRAFRLPRVDVPDSGGLPVEELARLLSIK